MRNTIMTMALLILIGAPAAIAQTGGGSSTAVKNQGVPPAPVGHRQPRADQVPNEKTLSDPNTPANKEDAILDKKIRSICRGC